MGLTEKVFEDRSEQKASRGDPRSVADLETQGEDFKLPEKKAVMQGTLGSNESWRESSSGRKAMSAGDIAGLRGVFQP